MSQQSQIFINSASGITIKQFIFHSEQEKQTILNYYNVINEICNFLKGRPERLEDSKKKCLEFEENNRNKQKQKNVTYKTDSLYDNLSNKDLNNFTGVSNRGRVAKRIKFFESNNN